MIVNQLHKNKTLLIAVIVSIFYFSWIQDSTLASEWFVPYWIREWANHHYNLRTAIPFIPFGFFLEDFLNNIDGKNKRFVFRFTNLFLSIFVVSIAEGGQFFILNRHPDVMDVFYGILGSLLGFLMYYLLKKVNV